jgi:hypothetical protein
MGRVELVIGAHKRAPPGTEACRVLAASGITSKAASWGHFKTGQL